MSSVTLLLSEIAPDSHLPGGNRTVPPPSDCAVVYGFLNRLRRERSTIGLGIEVRDVDHSFFPEAWPQPRLKRLVELADDSRTWLFSYRTISGW